MVLEKAAARFRGEDAKALAAGPDIGGAGGAFIRQGVFTHGRSCIPRLQEKL